MPPTFSHSRLSTFENCPRQYRYRYIERLPRPWTGVEAHAGAAVHAALERLYAEKMRTGRTPSLEDLDHDLREAWEKVPTQALRIVRRGFDAEDYLRLARHCLETYYRRHHPFDADETLDVEARVEITLGQDPPARMVGFMDRLARAPDGAWEIHDYKTSGSLPREQDLDRDRQLSLYELALRRTLPARAVVRQVWHYLTFDRRYVRTRPARGLAQVARQVEAAVQRVLAERSYPARTGVLCHWCDYSEHCPEGRSYVMERPAPGLPG